MIIITVFSLIVVILLLLYNNHSYCPYDCSYQLSSLSFSSGVLFSNALTSVSHRSCYFVILSKPLCESASLPKLYKRKRELRRK